MPRGQETTTTHNLYPKCRGDWKGKNRVEIDEILHYAWHAMTDRPSKPKAAIPEEVLQDLLDIWWPNEGYTITVTIGRTQRILPSRIASSALVINCASGVRSRLSTLSSD